MHVCLPGTVETAFSSSNQLQFLWLLIIATGLQLVLVIIVLICSLYSNCFCFVSPCCTIPLSSFTNHITYVLLHKIVFSYSTVSIQASSKTSMAKHLEEMIMYIAKNNCKSMILGMWEETRENVYWTIIRQKIQRIFNYQ